MEPPELVNLLVQRAGGELPVAKKMGTPSFQPTLYRFTHGMTAELKRASAEKIARHFGISVDALFSASAATAEAERLGLNLPAEQFSIADASASPAAHVLREPPPPPLDFADRREVTPSDWATLQAVKVVLDESELESIRKRADALMERAKREMAERMEKFRG